jgi:hypothetical protein
MKAIIICERDDWTWRIEAQEGCSKGVELVYQERGKDLRYSLGSVDDVEALADAIQEYVTFYRRQKNTD